MDVIVCATRGGEGSRAVQLAAIERAKETGHRLVFLYVVSYDSVGEVDKTLETAVREELIWMGKALLNSAQKRAEMGGVKSQLVIREGRVRDEICNYLAEEHAGLLMLGTPRGTTTNVFGDDLVELFAESISESTGIPVEIVRPETLKFQL